MRTPISKAVILSLLALSACGKSSSSHDDAPAAAQTTPSNGSDASASQPASGSTGTSATGSTSPADTGATASDPAGSTGEAQDALKLDSAFLEYSLLQYDCGDIAAPLPQATVESQLAFVKSFSTLAATIPAKDHALLKVTTTENGLSCTYRVLFDVNKSFTEVTYTSSQALTNAGVTGCGANKVGLDTAFGSAANAFEYDKKFIRWVALHIPAGLQASAICPAGSLRAVFSGATL